MTKVVIYDAMSTIRERMEARREPAQMLIRGVLNEAMMPGRTTIYVWDGKGGNAKRRAIFPAYKSRPPTATGVMAALDFFRELLALTPTWQIRLDGYEGDDVISHLVQKFANCGQPIEIHTRDGDLVALCTAPHITCTAKPKVTPNLVRLYKLCVGDASDTIPGIKGFGQKTWDECDKIGLQRFLDKVLDRHPWDEKEALAVGLSKASTTWLSDHKNQDELRAMWVCLNPLPISDSEIDTALFQGRNDPIAREAKLKEFLL